MTNQNNLNCSVGKKYKKKNGDSWDGKKYLSGLNVLSPAWWGKTSNMVLRLFIVAAIVFGITFASGYWQGMKRKPVVLGGYKDFIAYLERGGVEHKLEVRDGHIYLDEKIVRASDVPQLKPYGIKIRPKIFAGVSTAVDAEVGLGAEIAHYFKWNFDVFGTQKAAYFGVSYDLELADWMRNSSVGAAFGKAWRDTNDSRFIFYWAWKF
ncbi:MAG: hypothetical protein ACFFAU_01450 [Candidatus Hodarchaeota archaeon]